MSARVKNSSRDSSRPRPRPAVRPALRPTLRLAPAVRAPRPAARALTRPGATPVTRPGATPEALRPPRMTVSATPAAGRPPRTTVGATPARRPPRTVGAAALLRMAPRTLPRELATESGRPARPRPPPADLETSRAGARPAECGALVLGRLFPSKRSESVICTPAAPRPECTTTARPRPAESVPPRPESVGRCARCTIHTLAVLVARQVTTRVASPARRASIKVNFAFSLTLHFPPLIPIIYEDFELASRRAAPRTKAECHSRTSCEPATRPPTGLGSPCPRRRARTRGRQGAGRRHPSRAEAGSAPSARRRRGSGRWSG